MKKLLAGAAVAALSVTAAHAGGHGPVKVGVMLGFTGPIESLTPSMADGAEMAMKEVTDSGLLLAGATVSSVRAASTCIDAEEAKDS